ncbi:hypothetical protein FKP32DRAFT_1754791 [Trametes sanguinea]|nr:hypothetical protein FKP32DRAFT_1754791 [Trametes sanguinea]
MPPRKNPDLKQGKLSFASKRNSSTATAAGSKKKSSKPTPSRKASRVSPSPASATEPITNVIDIISSSDDSGDEDVAVPAAKKRRLNASGRAQRAEVEVVAPEPEREKEPLDVKDKRWRKAYSHARGKMGNIKPVHTEGQTMVHHILRVFDLSYEYGPCVGISRLDRWERAQALGLNPPPEVKEILLTKEGSTDEQFSQSVFHGEA